MTTREIPQGILRELVAAFPADQHATLSHELRLVRRQQADLKAQEHKLLRQLNDYEAKTEEALRNLYDRLRPVIEGS